jgi:PAS domain S-box-containing protein
MNAEMEGLLAAAAELAQVGGWERDLRSGESLWSDQLYAILGIERGDVRPGGETLLSFVHPADRERIAAVMATVARHPEQMPEEGLKGEFRVVRPEGDVRDVRVRGRVEVEGGQPVRWLATLHDVTDQRLTERELEARFAVSQALREWESFEEGVVDLLRRLGTALDYPMASFWLWSDEDEALVCRAFWSAPDCDPGAYELAKRTQKFRPGEGKPGLAWQLREPVITADTATDDRFRPRDAAVERGVTSGIAFPAVGYEGPVAVLSFYSFEPRVPSDSLVRTLTGIGGELGRFLSRRRAQLGPRPLSEREIEILRVSAEGLSGPEIAERLVISRATVKTHFQNIYEKLGVSDRVAAVAWALRTGLIS